MLNNKPYLITIILLSLTLAGIVYLCREKDATSLAIKLEDFPLDLGEWKGQDLPFSEKTLAILETRDVLMREYTNSQGERVYLAIVYSATNRSSFHPPEICYLGGGTELLNKGVEEIEIAEQRETPYVMQANRLLMKDRVGEQIAWYWFSAGKRITSNYYRQQLFIVWDGMRRRQSGGALTRISTRVIEDNLESAEKRGKDFIGKIAPLLLNYLSPKN